MKKIFLLILMLVNLYGNINIQQNFKALYKDVKLTENQKDYILDNQEDNIKNLSKELNKNFSYFKPNSVKEKNVISFELKPNGKIENFKFLRRSNNRKIDKLTKKSIKHTKFIAPNSNITMRFIISFNNHKIIDNMSNITNKSNQTSFIKIMRGTTRFQHTTKEYVRTFETSRDGFVNLGMKPSFCAKVKLLTNDNQKIHTGYSPTQFNKELLKGKYKLLIRTNKTCDIDFQYL